MQTILGSNLISLELEFEKILTKGAEELKIVYFNFAILLENEATNIGIHSISFNKNLMKINKRPMNEYIKIKVHDLKNIYPEIKFQEALEIFEIYHKIYESPFFEKMKNPYKGSIDLEFAENQVNIQNIDLSNEFKIYKVKFNKEELEKELPLIQSTIEKKIKI